MPSAAPPSLEATPRPSIPTCTPDESGAAVDGETSSAPPPSEAPLTVGPLEPGRYTTTTFYPRIALTLGPGWRQLFEDDTDELAFERADGFLGFGRVDCVVDPKTGWAVDAPDDLAAWLAEHEALTFEGAAEVTVAGLPGTRVEVTSTRTVDLFHYPTGNFRAVADNRFRWYIVSVNGRELTITAAAPVAAADAVFADVQAILDSLEVFP